MSDQSTQDAPEKASETPPVETAPATPEAATVAPEAQEAPAAEAQPAPAADPLESAPEPPKLADVLQNPEIKAHLYAETKKAAASAVEAHKAAEEKAASRAKMDEVERLKLEMREATDKQVQAEARATEAVLERDLANVLVTRGDRLQDEKALEYVKFQAFKLVEANEGMAMDVAVTQIVGESPWLLSSSTPAPSGEAAAQAPVVRPSTGSHPKETTAPPAQEPSKGVDVLSMSRSQYEEYRRKTHNLH